MVNNGLDGYIEDEVLVKVNIPDIIGLDIKNNVNGIIIALCVVTISAAIIRRRRD